MKIRNSCPILLFLIIMLMLPLSIAAQDAGPECGDSLELYAPENSLVTSVETDGYSGSITYKTSSGNKDELIMDPLGDPSGTLPTIFPMYVSINETPATLQDLARKVVEELKVLKRDCYSVGFPGIPSYHLTSQWIVMAKLSKQTGGQRVRVKGKITQIDPADPNNPNEVGRLVVKSETIVVTTKTRFKGTVASEFTELIVGQKIRLKGKRLADGTIKAKVIRVK